MDDYDEKYMKIKSNLDDKLPLNKTINIPSLIIVLGLVFHEDNKYYPQTFLDESLYKLWIIQKCYIMIELLFWKELMLIRQASQKTVIFVSTGVF